MRIAIDTNILVYAEGINGSEARQAAKVLISRIRSNTLIMPAQVLGELFNVLQRKGKFSGENARLAVLSWGKLGEIVETSATAFRAAVDLAADHHPQIRDAVILSVASEARCTLLLSEDMQDGFSWGGVTVVNPFAPCPHALLAAALRD